MKATNTRRPLQQQAVPEQKGPFFSKANDDAKKKDDAFFQTKLAVNEPGDKHEQEADQVADKVQRKIEEKQKPEVQLKSKDEENKAPAAMPVKSEEKKPAAESAVKGKDEEKKKVSKKDEDKKPDLQKMDKKDEEKPVQKMNDGDKKEEDKTKVHKKEQQGKPDKEEPVMKKESGAAHGGHKVSVEERIKQSKGKGQSLPDDVRAFLEKQLGADLGEVVVHTDGEAIAMNKELGALAFTNGFDIYFNAGQYQPDTMAGQKLLAHELTHVLQQTGVSKKTAKK